MNVEEFLDRSVVIDMSFFNFRNAISAAYFANDEFKVLKFNKNFQKFFPVLGNVSNAYFPDVLEQLGVPGEQIDVWITGIRERGSVALSKIQIDANGESRFYSLISARTVDDGFTYLNGIQGQFIDRTDEWNLRQEREELLEEKIRNREKIEEKNLQLENLAKRLAKYLSPQIYESIFADVQGRTAPTARKNLTIFFSDIERFTDLSDTLEPERLAKVINSYLSEMSTIAIECGGTIDKFIGDAVMVFFGDPESEGEVADALKAVEMALLMKQRVADLQSHWKKLGVPNGLSVRVGIATGFCTVGNFGSDQRLDYTVLGSPVNLAARLQTSAPPNEVLIEENTFNLIREHVECEFFEEMTPKGFTRATRTYRVKEFISEEHLRHNRLLLSRTGDRVEVTVLDSSDIRAAIEELRRIQTEFEDQLNEL